MPLTPEQIDQNRAPVQWAGNQMLRTGGVEWLYARLTTAGVSDARVLQILQEFRADRKAERLAELRGVRKAAVEAGVTKAEWETIPEEVTP
ncbi:MAG: hypothetical protein AMXMBFR33_01350 [Candidatus Xenobia bacterium]